MSLFLSIIAISFLLTICKDVIKFLRIPALFTRICSKPSQSLQDELQRAEAEYKLLKSDFSKDSYGHTIYLMRAEEKVKEAKSNIMKEKMVNDLKSYSAEFIIGYGLKALLYITLAVISIRNRYNPVMILNEDISLQPLRGLLSFPTGVPNAISVPLWILSCNVTFGLISGLVKERRSVQ